MPDRTPFDDGLDADLRQTFDHMLEGVQLIDAEYRYRYLNETAAQHGQRSREELIGKRMTEMYPGIQHTTMFANLRNCFQDGTPRRLLNEFTFPDGRTGWFELRMARVPAGVLIMSLDVTDQKSTESALQRSVAALEATIQRRTEFLTMLAHELRNPLATLRNGVHVVSSLPAASDPVTRATTESMGRQLRHLGRLVDDLLDAARLTLGQVQLVRERIDICELLRDVVADHRAAFHKHGLSLRLETPAVPIWIDGDVVRLSQSFANLLSNALKFTDAGPHAEESVFVRATASLSGPVVVTIRDTGIGVAAETLPFVFEPLYQADSSLERTRGGLGMGLTVARTLVKAHGGTVTLESAGLGRGATARVELPRLAEPAAVAAEKVARLATPPRSVVAVAAASSVLVIEDNIDAARTLGTVLSLWGYQVHLAHSGPEGIETARTVHPHIIVCDVGLPGMDGYAVARVLRQEEETRNARLIAITGYGRDEDTTRARDAGFDVHLVKPVDPLELRTRLLR